MNIPTANLPPIPTTAAGSATTTALASATSTTDGSMPFKALFDQAVSSAIAATSETSASPAAVTSSVDALEATLKKKIAALLDAGTSVSDIVQQLAGSLAQTFANAFGGDPAQVRDQLQSAFTSALSPPGSTGPPLSAADLASALAQRFRQIADVAAGGIGETGQSNRLFAGSISDAATTAGEQPAPDSNDGTGPTTADSNGDASATLLTALIATPSGGPTVALNGATPLGSNGDSLLGRTLARAVASLPTPTTTATATLPASASGNLVNAALDAASRALLDLPGKAGTSAAGETAQTDSVLRTAQTAPLASANSGSGSAANLNPALSAFLKTFTTTLAAIDGTTPPGDKGSPDADGTVLSTAVASSQAPTIGAFAPVQASAQTGGNSSDSASANQTASTTTMPGANVVPDSVVNQLVRGVFPLSTGPVSSSLRLKLVPESLGDLSVKLNVTGTSVDAQVIAQTPAAHDALVAGQSQLARALSDAGLKLNSFTVDLAGGGLGSFQQQQQSSSQQQQQWRPQLMPAGVDTGETTDDDLLAVPSFGPPSAAAPNGWGVYNYLV